MQIKGHIHYNSQTDVMDLTFWVEDAGAVVAASLGTLNYQLFDRNGNIITDPEATGSIPPGAGGLYTETEIPNPTFLTNRESFLLYAEVTVGVTTLSTYLPFTITNI